MKAYGFILCCCFYFRTVCFDIINFCLADVTIGSYVSRVSTRYTLQLFTRENNINREISVMNEPAHVAVGLQLLEMSSITTITQTISNFCTWYIFQRVFF